MQNKVVMLISTSVRKNKLHKSVTASGILFEGVIKKLKLKLF